MSRESLNCSDPQESEPYKSNGEILCDLSRRAMIAGATVSLLVEVEQGGRVYSIPRDTLPLRPALARSRYALAQPMYVFLPDSQQVIATYEEGGVYKSRGVISADGDFADWVAGAVDDALSNLREFGGDMQRYAKWATTSQDSPRIADSPDFKRVDQPESPHKANSRDQGVHAW